MGGLAELQGLGLRVWVQGLAMESGIATAALCGYG